MKRLITLAATIGLAVPLVVAAPAQADTQWVFQGRDGAYVQHGYKKSASSSVQDHRLVAVVDRECDGRTVGVRYRLELNPGVTYWIYDRKCRDGYAVTQNWARHGESISAISVCEYASRSSRWICSRWRTIASHYDV